MVVGTGLHAFYQWFIVRKDLLTKWKGLVDKRKRTCMIVGKDWLVKGKDLHDSWKRLVDKMERTCIDDEKCVTLWAFCKLKTTTTTD